MGNKKGPPFEREIVKELSLWWTDDEFDDVFYRTAGSGSRFTTRKKQGKDTANSAGDVGYLDVIGEPLISNYVIEIKRGYSNQLSVLDFVDKLKGQKQPTLYNWWEKANKEMKDAGRKDVILIMKRDYKRKIICLRTETFNKLKDWHGNGKGIIENVIHIRKKHCCLTIMRWEDFVDAINPHSMIRVQAE